MAQTDLVVHDIRLQHESIPAKVPTDASLDTPTQCALSAEIDILETRAKYAFGEHTTARGQVQLLLASARAVDLKCGTRQFLERAQRVFRDRLLGRNRTRYLVGVMAGIVINILLAQFAWLLSSHSLHELGMETVACCVWVLLFAGMGTLCSVYARLASIDMCDEPIAFIIISSGVLKPIIASFFAFAIVQMLKIGMVHVGSAAGTQDNDDHHLYLLAAFLAGFSERFGPDLMGRAEGAFVAADKAPAAALGVAPGSTRTS